MATKLKQYTFRSRNDKYDWNTYLDGGIYRLVADEDFHVAVGSVRSAAFNAARAAGVKVRTNVEDGDLIVQAYAA